jgi:hypothetical protein
MNKIKTLGELKKSGYTSQSIKDELRNNLRTKIQNRETTFEGVHGFEKTVIPELERAILSRHNINLLGLRGQAKTRLARKMTELLDEYIPVVAGSDINDDPLNPISRFALELIAEKGDKTPITWMHRDERFYEKLATPDVTVADLIGDIDPIKAANLKLSYADDRVIHYGMIPRANRCIFVINEIPDLQARIQEYIDAKSGISARMSITAYENLLSAAERRCLVIGEKKTSVRLSDFMGIIPSITGKVELVYEGEQEGAGNVALSLIGDAVKSLFQESFPAIQKLEKEDEKTPYHETLEWFFAESGFELMDDSSEKLYKTTLDDIVPLNELLDTYKPDLDKKDRYFWKEFILWALVEYNKLSKQRVDEGYQFKDTFGSYISNL